MELWIIIGVCAAVFAMVIAVAGAYNLIPGGLPEPERPGRAAELPTGFRAGDIDALGFTRELRGYNMEQVDGVLATLQERIAEQQRVIDSLRAQATPPETASAESETAPAWTPAAPAHEEGESEAVPAEAPAASTRGEEAPASFAEAGGSGDADGSLRPVPDEGEDPSR